MTPSDIYYDDMLALCDKHHQTLTEKEIQRLQDHTRKTLTPDAVVMKVIYSYVQRSTAGLEKFNMTIGANPEAFSFWLRNMIEELQDATVYATRILEE